MNYPEYKKIISATPETEGLEYQLAVLWLNPSRLPIGVVSLGSCTDKVIKVPLEAVNRYGRKVPVIAIGQQTFSGSTEVTDIILSSNITMIGDGAFAGCSSLERITLPKGIKRIGENTFAGCTKLRDIYYEGTLEDWQRIDFHDERREIKFGRLIAGTPVQEIVSESLVRLHGNTALKAANIHLRCELPNAKNTKQFFAKAGKKDITKAFEQKF